MITLEDALNNNVFYHKKLTSAMDLPYMAFTKGKVKTWKTQPHLFYLPIRMHEGDVRLWMSNRPDQIDHDNRFRPIIRKLPDQFGDIAILKNHAFLNSDNWYTFDPTSLTEIELRNVRLELIGENLPNDVANFPLPQLHDWLIENPDSIRYSNYYLLYMKVIKKYLEAERDGLPVKKDKR
jgi:hypothetical protein